jgi:signal transduction histidine kinase
VNLPRSGVAGPPPVALGATMNAKAKPAAPDECERGDSHPLEIFPAFRNVPPSFTRNVAYTFIWNCLLGLMFWFIAISMSPRHNLNAEYFIWNLLTANAIGYTIHALFALGAVTGLEAWARRTHQVAKVLYYTLASSLGVVIGFLMVSTLVGDGTFKHWLRSPGWVAFMAFSSLLVSVILSVIFFWRERHARDEAELERRRLHAERVEREAVLANLRALQAQIEPHFLFNTLANVTSLIDPDPAKARRMLENFIRFLRSSLNATRSESTTLADEAELIAAYLDVLEIRMGARLRYEIDVPADLHAYTLPPMLLQPVVENSIRHGLEPKVEGGLVRVAARREGANVLVEISDSGVGFSPVTRGGVGLTNLRDRLRLIYGEAASLVVGESAAGGASVTLSLPA